MPCWSIYGLKICLYMLMSRVHIFITYLWYLCSLHSVFLHVPFTFIGWCVRTGILSSYNKLIIVIQACPWYVILVHVLSLCKCVQEFLQKRGSAGCLFCLFVCLFSEMFYHKITFLLLEFNTVVKLCSEMQSIMEEFIMTDPRLWHSHCRLFLSTLSVFSIFSYTQQYYLACKVKFIPHLLFPKARQNVI